MARTISESVPAAEQTAGATGPATARATGPAMAQATEPATEAAAKNRKAAAGATAALNHRTLAGPYGASFDGTDGKGHPVKGLTFERRWTTPGRPSLRRDHLGVPDRRHRQRVGQDASSSRRTSRSPSFWSQLATNVVVSKYFRGHLGTPERETSVRQLIDRVVNTITAWAETQHYFATDDGPRRPSRPS